MSEITSSATLPPDPQNAAQGYRPVWRRWGPGLLTLLPAAVLLLVAGWILFPSLFTAHDPLVGNRAAVLHPPSWTHLFGTDHLGRDVFSRTVHGSSQTALTAGVAVIVGAVIGGLMGLVAASGGRVADTVLMRIVDTLVALPAFLVAVLVVTLVGRGAWQIAVGVAFGSVATFARVMRAEVLKVRTYDFIAASRLSGSGYSRVIFRRILPNAIGPVLALGVTELGGAILAVAALGFIGFGNPPPTPEWGLIVADGRNYLARAWWVSTLPGAVICIVVLAIGAMGRKLGRRARL